MDERDLEELIAKIVDRVLKRGPFETRVPSRGSGMLVGEEAPLLDRLEETIQRLNRIADKFGAECPCKQEINEVKDRVDAVLTHLGR
ncbi:hypothetical protein [Pararobbsia alpina]|uniref:hypothetical protein n=1 Tax=Pararobbsia alpina TaxID=621374 RepID=UPI0039A51503